MKYSVLLLGWDVGPWKCSGNSKDALVLVGWDGSRLSVIDKSFHGNLLTKLSGELDLRSLLGLAGWSGSYDGMKVVLAVDAVFGWPRHFVELITGKTEYTPKTDEKDKNWENRFLYRETERFLIHALNLRSPNLPKTAVGEAIGSAATKTQYVLSLMKKREAETVFVPPLDLWDEKRASEARVTIIEVYPGVTRFSPAFEKLDCPHGVKMKLLGRSDPEDALRCAMIAACYAGMTGAITLELPDLYVPTDATLKDGFDLVSIPSEGWIFSPKKQ